MYIFQKIISMFGLWKKAGEGLAVVIVDMQPGFLEDIPDHIKTQMILAQLQAIERCSVQDAPVVYLEFFDWGETEPEIVSAIQKVPRVERLVKYGDNGFRGTGLKEILQKWGIGRLLIAGVNANACVKKTVKGAMWRGFQVLTRENLVADYRDEEYKKFLAWSRRKGFLFSGPLQEVF